MQKTAGPEKFSFYLISRIDGVKTRKNWFLSKSLEFEASVWSLCFFVSMFLCFFLAWSVCFYVSLFLCFGSFVSFYPGLFVSMFLSFYLSCFYIPMFLCFFASFFVSFVSSCLLCFSVCFFLCCYDSLFLRLDLAEVHISLCLFSSFFIFWFYFWSNLIFGFFKSLFLWFYFSEYYMQQKRQEFASHT